MLWLGLIAAPLWGQPLRIELDRPSLVGGATAYVPTADLELAGRVVPSDGVRLIINDVDVPVGAHGSFAHQL
ncbi:MAG: hypothetical protein KDB96_19205, partial [Flavobacteriales bacterium]|nr:hypothetical protein [Flavobacteriales bacterium]